MKATNRPSAIREIAYEMGVLPSFVRRIIIDSSDERLSMRSFEIDPELFMTVLESEVSYFIDNDLYDDERPFYGVNRTYECINCGLKNYPSNHDCSNQGESK